MANQKQFEKSMSWSDKFMPDIMKLLELEFSVRSRLSRPLKITSVQIASEIDDKSKNTDVLIKSSNCEDIRIACRVRAYEWFVSHPDEFTIRYDRPDSSHKIEAEKCFEGYGDFLFYGFTNLEETKVYAYKIISLVSLTKFRNNWIKRNDVEPGKELSNHADDLSIFRAFKDWMVEPNIIRRGFE